jgi:hypothetical protein
VLEPSISEVEVVIGKLKQYKSPCADHIPAELMQVGGTLHSEIHKLIKLIGTKKNCPTCGRNQLSCLFTKRVIKRSAVIIGAYDCCQLHTKFYPTSFSLG